MPFKVFLSLKGVKTFEIGEEIYKTVNAIAPIMTETGWRSLEAE